MMIQMAIDREYNGKWIDAVECEFEYHRAYKGARDSISGVRGAGPALEPDEPAHFELIGAYDIETGEVIELTNDEIDDAEQKAWESFN